jgi:hypothetical protein
MAVVLALGLSLAAGLSFAQDGKAAPTADQMVKAMAEVGKPGPGHAKLAPLAGNWTYTCKFWMDPNQSPLQSKGTIERKWILGGRFLEEKVQGTHFDGKPGFEGRGLIGYDNGQQKYTTSWTCNMGTGTCTGVGVSDSPGRFTFQTESFCPMMKKVVKGREEIRFEGDDKVVAESYVSVDGKEMKMMELVSVRAK